MSLLLSVLTGTSMLPGLAASAALAGLSPSPIPLPRRPSSRGGRLRLMH